MKDKKGKTGNQDKGTILADFVAAADQADSAVAVTDTIYLSKDMGDCYMITTPAGNVVVNTGFPGTGATHKARFAAVSDQKLAYIVLTQCHANQFGGAMDMKGPDTKIIAQQRYPECRQYWKILHDFYARRSNKLWGTVLGDRSKLKDILVEAELDILFDDHYAFELGGRQFELLATPGGESRDSLVVWLPQDKVLLTGNLFGPIFGHLPNLYTIRGDKIRSAQAYLASLERVRALEPELLLTGHGKPVTGAENIRRTLDTLHGAVQYIHDQTVAGMNAGADVYTLMREITLPDHLQVGQGHGKVSWCVRAIWEEYAGWFHYDSTASLYGSAPDSVAADLVELAGGAEPLAQRAQAHVAEGEPLAAVRLVDIALAAEPGNRAALQAKLAAHELLLEQSGETFSEIMWLKAEIRQTQELLEPSENDSNS
jgi:glyoxylase-like metal-dependent hydrolase (beta-lactamase superfamily II)